MSKPDILKILVYILFFTILLIIILYILYFYLNIHYPPKKIIKYDAEKKLNEVSIFGTHNSLTYTINNIFSPFAKTQTLSLLDQLYNNIRFFDLRFKIKDNKLIAYHNFINLKIDHEEVFNIFLSFLKSYPEQFIIINLKNEEFKEHYKIMTFLYENYINVNKLNNKFIFNNSSWSFIPTIKEIQGKIFIFNFHTIKNNMPWSDNREFIIGKNHISDIYISDVSKKILAFENFIKNKKDNNLNIFFFSMQYNNILGLKYDNQILSNKIIKIFNDKKYKNINMILVFDYFEMFNYILYHSF